jgi:signal transduction histidine kinase
MLSATGAALPLVALGYVSVPLLLWVVWYAVRTRDRPSATAYGVFTAAVIGLFVTTFASDLATVEQVAGGAALRVAGSFVGGFALPVSWVAYTLAYTGRGDTLTRRRIGAICTPFLLIALAFGGVAVSQQGFDGSQPPWIRLLLVVLSLVFVLYIVCLLLFGAYLLVKLRRTYDTVPIGQVGTQVASLVLIYAIIVLTNLTSGTDGPPIAPFDAVYPVFFISAVGLAVATWRYPVCSALPEAQYVARDEVVENLREGVVVLDRNNRVLDLNPTATTLLDCSAETAIGEPAESLVDADTLPPGSPTGAVTIQTADGMRQLEIGVSEIGDEGRDSVGRTLVMRDVTERKTRKQRLEVLNRVLRHNLRNNVDAILAHASTVDDPDQRGETIRDLAGELARVSKKARDVERLLDADRLSFEQQNVSQIVRAVATDAREAHPTSDIDVTAPSAVTVRTDETVFRRVVAELVENAARHGGGQRPQVEITVRDHGDRVSVAVADDGPGIPDRERQALTAGTETPLEHGTGIGLWLVNWGTRYIGGTVSFDAEGESGSVVTVSVPA